MTFQFDKTLFVRLSFAFVIFTVLGTQSHEWAHYFTARWLGLNAQLHFASTTIEYLPLITEFQNFLVTLAGPLFTVSIGSTGLLLILSERKHFLISTQLTPKKWLMVLLSFFFSRQVLNFCTYPFILSNNNDEIKIANYFSLPDLSVSFLSAILGSTILMLVVFKFVPKSQRATLLAAGLAGSSAGYFLWFQLLGPLLLP